MDFQQPLALEASLPLGTQGIGSRHAHFDGSRADLFVCVLPTIKSDVETFQLLALSVLYRLQPFPLDHGSKLAF